MRDANSRFAAEDTFLKEEHVCGRQTMQRDTRQDDAGWLSMVPVVFQSGYWSSSNFSKYCSAHSFLATIGAYLLVAAIVFWQSAESSHSYVLKPSIFDVLRSRMF